MDWKFDGFDEQESNRNFEVTPEATKPDGQPWEFVGGIQFDQEATISDELGVSVLHIMLPRPKVVTRDPNEAYRTLVKRWPDGTVKYLLISFRELVE